MALEKSGTNVGTLCKIELVSEKDVANMPHAYYGEITGDVTLAEGKSWENIYFTQDTAHFVEQPVVINGAEFHELVLKWKVPKDTAVKMAYTERLSQSRYIARLTDTNEEVTLAGTPDEPCRVKRVLRDKGQNIRDSNHYIMELRLVRRDPVPVVT